MGAYRHHNGGQLQHFSNCHYSSATSVCKRRATPAFVPAIERIYCRARRKTKNLHGPFHQVSNDTARTEAVSHSDDGARNKAQFCADFEKEKRKKTNKLTLITLPTACVSTHLVAVLKNAGMVK